MRPLAVMTVLVLALAVVSASPTADKPGRDLISVEFKKINDKEFPVVSVKNLTGKDIDDVRGSFVMEDQEGNVLFSTGQTEAVPGSVFLTAGETKDWVPFGLNRKAELMERLRSDPASVRFFFEVRAMTFMDGTETTPIP